jgi:CHAD domain-containing protein
MRFRAGETLAEAVDRVVGEQFEIALTIAASPPDLLSVSVHETRKSTKRLRAVLRLLRGTISMETFRSANTMLRLIAAELGAVRDSWVMAQLLHRLLPSDDPSGEVEELIGRLQNRYRAESESLLDNEAQMQSIVDQLGQVRSSTPRWTLLAGDASSRLPHEFGSIAAGLRRVYRRGRKGMHIVIDSPSDTLLHVWRKRAKYLRHQIEALNVIDPEQLTPLEADLERLSDLLGDDHDLALLLNRLREDRALTRDLVLDDVLESIIATRSDLQADSIALGRSVYADPSADFIARLEKAWGETPTF